MFYSKINMRIGVIGGTGKEGRGLALRWARAGHAVALGSRDPAHGRECARELSRAGFLVGGGSNDEASEHGEVVVLSVPYSAHTETLTLLAPRLTGKILLDITVPLRPPKVRQVHLPPGRAAALEARALLAETTRVVAALHHVGSAALSELSEAIDCDVLVCGDDEDARRTVIHLVEGLGMRGLDAGPLENAIALESLTPVLLHLNKVYGAACSGIRFTGLPR